MEGISLLYIFLLANRKQEYVGQENVTRWLGGTISGVFHYPISTDERRLKRRSIGRLDNAAGDPWAALSSGHAGRSLILVKMDDHGTAVRIKQTERAGRYRDAASHVLE